VSQEGDSGSKWMGQFVRGGRVAQGQASEEAAGGEGNGGLGWEACHEERPPMALASPSCLSRDGDYLQGQVDLGEGG
jgi:hypothetical protein